MGLTDVFKEIWNSTPKHSAKRQYRPVRIRAYDGATRGRLNRDWSGAMGTSANTEVYGSLETLRNRSRDLLRNNDYARGVIRCLVDNVVFTGIGFQATVKQVKDKTINDDRVNNAIESKWREWSGNPDFCDVSGVSDWGEIQQLVFKSFLESGEVFVRKIEQSFGGSKVPFALEIIESDRVIHDYNSTHNGNQIVMGVEIDRWKRPVAYWMHSVHPGDFWGVGSYDRQIGKEMIRVPASEIIHVMARERPNQLRGMPLLYSTITRLRNLGEYEKSELVAARAAAAIMGLVTTPNSDLLSEPSVDGEAELPADEKLAPGMLRYLAPGEGFESFTPNRPNSAFATFFESQLRGVGAGVGASYENVSNDYSKSNYSSSRLSLLQARDRYRMLQQFFICQFNRKVYKAWLERAVLAGALRFSDYEIRPERYLDIRWTPRGWSWVDPHKEINATIAAIAHGLTTTTAEVAKQGGDFEENLKVLAREKAMLEQYGIELPSLITMSNDGKKQSGDE